MERSMTETYGERLDNHDKIQSLILVPTLDFQVIHIEILYK